MIKVDDIYKFRKYLRTLYDRDVHMKGDLGGDIGKLTTQPFVESFYFAPQQYFIKFVLNDTSAANVEYIINWTRSALQKFVRANLNIISFTLEERESFLEFISHPNMLAEVNVVGNTIVFSL